MELFTVNRYIDDKDVKTATSETAILDNLLSKIEKHKKKQKETKATKSKANLEEQTLIDNNTAAENNASTTDKAATTADEVQKKGENEPEEDQVETAGFQVLGEDVNKKQAPKVDMILPEWLAHPTIISTSIKDVNDMQDDDETTLSNINYLAPHIRHSLKEMQITRMFPVQAAVIPWILQAHNKPPPFRPRDICVSAPTGSGKTLAFAVPIVQLLAKRVERKIRALVVLPVSELALQVYKVFDKLCKKTDLTVCLLSKQLSLAEEQDNLVELYKGKYYSKVDILVTTPGRLVEHLHATKGFCLKSLKFLVIDEADRIMDALFQNWLYHLDAHVRETSDQLLAGRAAPLCYNELVQSSLTQPHKLLFSATLSQDPEKLQNLRLFQPKLFTSVIRNVEQLPELLAGTGTIDEPAAGNEVRGEFVGKYSTPAELTEKYCITESKLKPLTLYSLIIENGWKKFLCFTNSIEASGRLSFVLKMLLEKANVKIAELSGGQKAVKRSQVLSEFARGKIAGLVCSDALARGIDIPDVDVVISYDPPRHIKTYIHRIGRTARAGRLGTAITLVTEKELGILNKTLAEAGKTLTDEIIASRTNEEDIAKAYTNALGSLKHKLELDKKEVLIKKRQEYTKSIIFQKTENLTLVDKLKLQTLEKKENRVKRGAEKQEFIPKRLRPKQKKIMKKLKIKKNKLA